MAENLRQTFQDIADAIRDRLDVKEYPIKPVEFADEVRYIPQSSGGGHYQDPSEILEGTITYCSNSASFIKPYTFGFCSLLSEVDFSKCKTIGSRAFESCSTLENISFPMCEEIGSYAFYNCTRLTEASFPACKIVHNQAFQSCSNLNLISLPECQIIRSSAFTSCNNLTSVYLPNCKIIESYVFSMNLASNPYFTELNLPECRALSYMVFYSAEKISYINLPKCIAASFYATMSSSVVSGSISINYPNLVFRPYGVSLYNSPTSVDCQNLVIGGDCFAGWSNLSYISLPKLLNGYNLSKLVSNGVLFHSLANRRIADQWNHYTDITLRSHPTLTTISLPALTATSTSAFADNINLVSVSLPRITTIGESTFDNCVKLSTIFLPLTTYIYSSAFKRCISLEKVVLLQSSVGLYSTVFENTPMIDSSYLGYYGSIYVLPSRVDYFKSSLSWSRYKDRIVAIPESEMTEIYSNYVLASEFYRDSNITEIPSERQNVKQIFSSAFTSCSNLQAVSLPNCEHIGAYAFQYCSAISQLSLPNTKYIGDYTFADCRSLTSIYLPEALIIGDAFRNCSNLSTISLPECRVLGTFTFGYCSNLQYAYLPKCLDITDAVFYSCRSLSYVVFRDLVTVKFKDYNHYGTFFNCSNLWSVYFLGSIPIWFYSYSFSYSASTPVISTFRNTPITQLTYSEATGQSEYGKIYVRASLVSDFKILNSLYSEIQDRFVGLTDEEADNILNILDNGGTL